MTAYSYTIMFICLVRWFVVPFICVFIELKKNTVSERELENKIATMAYWAAEAATATATQFQMKTKTLAHRTRAEMKTGMKEEQKQQLWNDSGSWCDMLYKYVTDLVILFLCVAMNVNNDRSTFRWMP